MVQRREFFYPSADGRTRIHAVCWQGEGKPRAIVQISHGICEYVERYAPFAEYLAEHGFLVVGNDHLGHGKSFQDPTRQGLFAEKDGWSLVVRDIEALRAKTAGEHPGVPYFLLGHSMGSFLARTYLIRYPGRVDGALICGTGQQPQRLLRLGLGVTEALCRVRGPRYRSAAVKQMTFGSYNRRIQPVRTPDDWVCGDESVIDAYVKDPGCQLLPTVSLYRDMLGGIRFISQPENLAKMDKTTPVFFFAGAEDPVGDYGEGVTRAYDSFVRAGCSDVKKTLYPGARHEVLNDRTRDQVWSDVLAWIGDHLPGAEA